MLIKQQALGPYLARHSLPGIFLLTGQDHFLLTETAGNIKQTWRKNDTESEEIILHITNPSDWGLLEEKANSYSLFANSLFIDVRYEKQALDATGKSMLTRYLQNINPCCLLLIRAPNLSLKPLQSLVNHNDLQVVQIFPLDGPAMQNWIKDQLQKNGLKFEPQVPALIYQYTQGNMLACAQALEKIHLIADESILTTSLVKDQLVDQCDFQLFELSDACLLQDAVKVIQYLRHARNGSTEPTLILWLLAQDIRQLVQLIDLTKQSVPFTTACSQLKIWSYRGKLYQSALKRAHRDHLLQLLQFCKKVDECIKSNQSNLVWPALEKIALSLCLGKQVGILA